MTLCNPHINNDEDYKYFYALHSADDAEKEVNDEYQKNKELEQRARFDKFHTTNDRQPNSNQ